jgi:hypothetical protein
MQILDPELVEKASRLPQPVILATAAVGPLLWVLGWRIHRTIVVAASTVLAGVYGLVHGPALGLNAMVAAGLFSLSAGGLSLALLRIGVFVAGGVAVDLAVSAILKHTLPGAFPWAHVAAFLSGGLMGLFCYRLLVIVLTSFVGSYILLLGALAFGASLGEARVAGLAAQQPRAVAGAFLLLGLLGTVGQYWLERSRRPRRPLAKKSLRDDD